MMTHREMQMLAVVRKHGAAAVEWACEHDLGTSAGLDTCVEAMRAFVATLPERSHTNRYHDYEIDALAVAVFASLRSQL